MSKIFWNPFPKKKIPVVYGTAINKVEFMGKLYNHTSKSSVPYLGEKKNEKRKKICPI